MKLLIVEDDLGLQSQYKWSLGEDFDIVFASDREQAVSAVKEHLPPVVLLDLGLPPDADNASEGLLFLSQLMTNYPATKVVVLTGSEQREHAHRAVELGAWDFQQKGIDIDALKGILSRAFNMYEIDRENRDTYKKEFEDTALIGKSKAMAQAVMLLSRIAPMPVSTLILGESGTGKELFAHNLHKMSNRKGEFVAINCASIPAELLESELFGHEKGAFTGAHKAKIGKIERANNGTLFLDEIGDMPLELQAKMLRFLQEREIERLGSTKSISVDVRVICATHRDLKEMSDEKKFRLDLYYRLAEFTLNIPALRDREGDVILIAQYLLDQYNKEFNARIKGFSDDALTALAHYNFPGNIRELQNLVKGAIITAESDIISAKNLNLSIEDAQLSVPKSWLNDYEDVAVSLEDVRKEAESRALFSAYKTCDKNISMAAKMLGITRPTFYSLTEKYDMRIRKDAE